jgi:hypothetical protein
LGAWAWPTARRRSSWDRWCSTNGGLGTEGGAVARAEEVAHRHCVELEQCSKIAACSGDRRHSDREARQVVSVGQCRGEAAGRAPTSLSPRSAQGDAKCCPARPTRGKKATTAAASLTNGKDGEWDSTANEWARRDFLFPNVLNC